MADLFITTFHFRPKIQNNFRKWASPTLGPVADTILLFFTIIGVAIWSSPS